MFSKTLKTTLTAALLLTGSSALMAQDDELVAKKMEDVTKMEMTLIRWQTGKGRRATEMLKEHFAPAAEKAGTDMPWVMHFDTGTWHAALFWELKGGFADMDWEMSPDGVKFITALRELEGGKEGADKIFEEWRSLIAARNLVLGHHHLTDKEKEEAKKKK